MRVEIRAWTPRTTSSTRATATRAGWGRRALAGRMTRCSGRAGRRAVSGPSPTPGISLPRPSTSSTSPLPPPPPLPLPTPLGREWQEFAPRSIYNSLMLSLIQRPDSQWEGSGWEWRLPDGSHVSALNITFRTRPPPSLSRPPCWRRGQVAGRGPQRLLRRGREQ